MPEINIPYLKCNRCGHTWIPRSPNLPRVCARCNSPYWNKDRKLRGNKMVGPKKKVKKITPEEAEEIHELTGSGI